MKKIKSMMRSKTMWFNSVLLAALPVFEVIHDFMPELQSYLPDNIYKWVGIIVVVGNIWLRTKTTKPLDEK